MEDPRNCSGQNINDLRDSWLQVYSLSCDQTSQQFVGFLLGLISIAVWTITHIVQVIIRQQEYTSQKGSSFYSLLHDSIGNVLNFTGAILANQTETQILFGLYMLFADLVFFLQYLFSKCCRKCGKYSSSKNYRKLWRFKKGKPIVDMNALCMGTPWLLSVVTMTSFAVWHSATGVFNTNTQMEYRRNEQLFVEADKQTNDEYLLVDIGFTMGIVSTIFYWTGMITKVLKVFREKSFSGFHIIFLAFCILGNASYVISIFLQHFELVSLLNAMPWAIGRLGLVGLDCGILLQSILNRISRNKGRLLGEDVVSLLRNERPHNEKKVGQEKMWKPMEPRKNRYLRKMNRIARHLDNQFSDVESLDDEPQSEDSAALLPSSNKRKHKRKYRRPAQMSPEEFSDSSSECENVAPRNFEAEEWDLGSCLLESQYKLDEEQVYKILSSEDKTRQGLVLGGATVRSDVINFGEFNMVDEFQLFEPSEEIEQV